MKFKLCVGIIVILVLYMIIPTGEFGIDDVDTNFLDNRNSSFSSMSLSDTDFINRVDKINNPEVGFIVHPNTAIPRDGDNSVKGEIQFRAGNYYSSGKSHKAIDTGTEDAKAFGQCPSGHSNCDDTVLIAPVSGVIKSVVSHNGVERAHWQTGAGSVNSSIVISAKGAFDGRELHIYHLSSIPEYFAAGYEIKQGEYVGAQCSLGNSDGSHVHFSVRTGSVSLPVEEWFGDLILHSSIDSIEDTTVANPTIKRQGWTNEDMEKLRNSERYTSEVTIPDKFKLN